MKLSEKDLMMLENAGVSQLPDCLPSPASTSGSQDVPLEEGA